MESAAAKSAKGASQGIDGMTASMVKGATAGNLFADAIQSALAWAKEFTVGSVMMAAENAKAEASLRALATAHGVGAAAATRQVAAIEEIGFEFTEAAHAVQRLIVADMDSGKAQGLAKLAKDAAAVQNVSAGEAMDAIVLANFSDFNCQWHAVSCTCFETTGDGLANILQGLGLRASLGYAPRN